MKTIKTSYTLYTKQLLLLLASSYPVFFVSGYSFAAEITTFELTGVESFLEIRYLADERIDTSNGVETLNQYQTTSEQEFSVLTHSYVYHPSFLKLDLGAGFTFVQDSFRTGTGTNNTKDGLYSLHGRASFLEKKPFPISFFYTRDNPAFFPGLAERVQQNNTTYGFNFSLLKPIIPLKLDMFASSNKRKGSSPTQVVDDTTDRFGIRASKVFNDNLSSRIGYDYTDELSSSGNLSLPITPSSRKTNIFTYGTEWLFGAKKQLRYFDRATFTQQEGIITRDEINFAPNLLWKHSDKLRSSYHYNYLDSKQNSIATVNHTANAELNYDYNKNIDINTGAIIENNKTTGLNLRSTGVNGQISYKRPVTNGTLTLSAALAYKQNDREASATQANIIGEVITLTGLTPVALANEYIVSGSIVVQNLARSQIYVEGIDYRIIVVGVRTEIQRLSGSNIGDPQQVVIDYAYQTGGSAVYTNFEQNYRAGLTLYKHYNFYLGYRINDQTITSGSPTLPLNSQKVLSFGASANYPINKQIEVGADTDFVRHDENISPYDSQRFSAYSQFLLPYASNLRISASQINVDNHNSVEDINLSSYSMLFRSRPLDRMILSAEAHKEKDTGGTLLRERDTFKLSVQWHVYRLIMDAQAIYSAERTGAVETERTHFLLTLRREI